LDRQLRVRGFVALPASLSQFLAQHDYRMFFIRTRRCLRLRGFATAMVFIDTPGEPALPQRLKQYQVDTVVWFLPDRLARETSLQLGDFGIRVVAVGDGRTSGLRARYEIRREGALAALAKDWRARGISEATIVSAATRRSAADEERIEALFHDNQVETEFTLIDDEMAGDALDILKRPAAAGVVILGTAASLMAFRLPRQFKDLLRSRRVALVNGPVAMPLTQVPPTLVDIVAVDWQRVASTITDDLLSQQAARFSGCVFLKPAVATTTSLCRSPARLRSNRGPARCLERTRWR
jgi:hypothetical protein